MYIYPFSQYSSPQEFCNLYLSQQSHTITNQCCEFQSNSTIHKVLSSKVKSHRFVPVKRYSHLFSQRSTRRVVGILINLLTRPLSMKSFSIKGIYGAFSSENLSMSNIIHWCCSIAQTAHIQQLFRDHWLNIIIIL